MKSKLETSNKTNSDTVQNIKKALSMFNVQKTDKEEGECSFFCRMLSQYLRLGSKIDPKQLCT